MFLSRLGLFLDLSRYAVAALTARTNDVIDSGKFVALLSRILQPNGAELIERIESVVASVAAGESTVDLTRPPRLLEELLAPRRVKVGFHRSGWRI